MAKVHLDRALQQQGLRQMGDCRDNGATVTLIGPDEPRFWSIFSNSPEYKDGQPDPMDRWSLRVISAIADDIGAEPLFPFGGPPYAPFYSWAIGTGRFWSSPLQFLVHEDAGLFASLRGALRWDVPANIGDNARPCDGCAGQPCRSACPVDAFHDGYNVDACRAHVRSDAGIDCRTRGCVARRACPIGQNLRLAQQSAFHMEAFL